jgi:hypothetical protein
VSPWTNLNPQLPVLLGKTRVYSITNGKGGHSICQPFQSLVFCDLQESTKGAKTLLAKRAFEAHAALFGVKVLNYHADNGRFAELLFLDHDEVNGQTVSLCSVNAHFQNGVAEKRIGDLTACARTSLLRAMSRWPSAIAIHLWTHALRFANDVYNADPTLKNGRTLGDVLRNASTPPSPELPPSILPSLRPAQRSSGSREAT